MLREFLRSSPSCRHHYWSVDSDDHADGAMSCSLCRYVSLLRTYNVSEHWKFTYCCKLRKSGLTQDEAAVSSGVVYEDFNSGREL